MRNHAYNIAIDAQLVITQEAHFVCSQFRAPFYPLADAEFSASGCIDAPMWIPAGYCGQWFHNAGHVGMVVACREGE